MRPEAELCDSDDRIRGGRDKSGGGKRNYRKRGDGRTPRRTRSCVSECSTLHRPCQLRKSCTGHARHLRRVSESPRKKPKVWEHESHKCALFIISFSKEIIQKHYYFFQKRNNTEIIYGTVLPVVCAVRTVSEPSNHAEHPELLHSLIHFTSDHF